MLIGTGGSENVSVHHNFFAHNVQRHPEISSGSLDWMNNVIYNYGIQPAVVNSVYGAVNGNWVGNYWKHGADTVFANSEFRFISDRPYSSTSSKYVSDNKMDTLSGGIQKRPR
jgi:pectate lyase